jgi:hypothetical protein
LTSGEVRFRLVLNGHGGESIIEQPLKASATFEIDYKVPSLEGIKESDLQAFADTGSVFSALPYWRQLVQSTLPSMGIHERVVPVVSLPAIAISP